MPTLYAAAAVWIVAALAAQQPRDNPKRPEAGAGAVGGLVTDAADGRPLRRARVRISSAELVLSRTTITADDGSFTFEGLPSGRFTLSAAKEGHVAMNFGASRPGRPGKSIILAPSAPRARIQVALPRGSVITGTVLNPEGEPAPGVSVTILASVYDGQRGERRVSAVPDGTVTTDDRGMYRIYGLPAGTYFISAIPRRGARGFPGDAVMLTQSEIRAALAEVRASRTATRPGIPAPPAAAPFAGEPPKSITLTPIFYPGTALQARAAPIELRAGEVRSGADIDLEYVRTSTIEGMVTVPPGMTVQLLIDNADVGSALPAARAVTRPDDDGRFSFSRIAPGSYTISARAFPSGARRVPTETSLWGETGVIVAGEDITGVTVPLLPVVAIAGRLVFDGSTGAAPDPGTIRIPMPVISIGGSGSAPLPSVLVDGSRFSITGVVPGVYRFSSPPRGVRAPIGPWWLKSIVVNGKELLDSELELRESTEDATITLSDRASQLSGAVTLDDDRTPVTDAHVIVFSTNSRYWFHNSRRVAGVRLASDGRYAVRNLPAGDYRIAVTNEIAPNEWFDPETLRNLQSASILISIRENEIRTLNVSAKN